MKLGTSNAIFLADHEEWEGVEGYDLNGLRNLFSHRERCMVSKFKLHALLKIHLSVMARNV